MEIVMPRYKKFFKDIIANKDIITDYSNQDEILFIIFAGMNGGLAMDLTDFGHLFDKFPNIGFVFVRDRQRYFYHHGFENSREINSEKDTIEYIQKIIDKKDWKSVIVFGNSAGGYMAILTSCLLNNVTKTLVFSPVVCLEGNYVQENHGMDEIIKLEKEGNIRYKDVNKFLYKLKNSLHIYYDPKNYTDNKNINRLNFNQQVKTFYVDAEGNHNVIYYLYKSNQLHSIISDAIDKNYRSS